jgi:hypothetical protein
MRAPIRLTVAVVAGSVVLAGTALASTALAGTTPTKHGPATAVPGNVHPNDAQQAILAAFDKYEVVAGMSPDHGVKDVDDFIIDLIRNPSLPGKVNDIAVECGNSLYQPILDRYIAGQDVPLTEVRQVWRNTTQPSCGFSTFYEELFPLVRQINEKLPQAKKLRVLACDPPVDWSKVTSHDDFLPFTDRDPNIASVMEREVLSKHRKALMLFGLAHVTHGSGAVGIYEQHYPNTTFVIADHQGFAKDNDTLEKRMASWPVPSLAPVKGTWLDNLDSSYFSGFPGEWGSAFVDAYLYVGRRALLMHQPISARTVLDEEYIAELERRADTVGAPPNGLMRPEVIFRNESESSTFF